MAGKRSDALYCSLRCKTAARRARVGSGVSSRQARLVTAFPASPRRSGRQLSYAKTRRALLARFPGAERLIDEALAEALPKRQRPAR
jgi:hypothetical protein